MTKRKSVSKQGKLKYGINEKVMDVADRLWNAFPTMKPIGEIRQRKHLAELDSLLLQVTEADLHLMVKTLYQDKYRKDWVSSLERIAEELPRIRSLLSEREITNSKGYVARWREQNRKEL